jgi:GTP diphosphokinase / guanosine-3',5'-bis(diphosphate) 3'-diphosphatase
LNGLLADVKYSYSRCCNPIPGDDVVGFISRDGEVKVHRTSCKNLKHLIKNDAERIVDVSWAKNTDTQFIGALKIIGEDRVGLINDISNVISNTFKTNMKSINVNSDSGSFEGTLIIFVENIKHLEKVIKRMQKIEGVKQVYRYE